LEINWKIISIIFSWKCYTWRVTILLFKDQKYHYHEVKFIETNYFSLIKKTWLKFQPWNWICSPRPYKIVQLNENLLYVIIHWNAVTQMPPDNSLIIRLSLSLLLRCPRSAWQQRKWIRHSNLEITSTHTHTHTLPLSLYFSFLSPYLTLAHMGPIFEAYI